MSHNIIKNETLLEHYLTPAMEKYFYIKLNDENPELVKLQICELLKFLSMSHHTHGNIPFDVKIDEIWHLWILQTVQYKELMEKLPGKRFINHCSNDYDDGTEDRDQESELNNQFSYLISYVANFGSFTSQTYHFWPMTKIIMQAMDFDLDNLNLYLKQLTNTTC